jgi:hypothetical protein
MPDRGVYAYNEDCTCRWCSNGGNVPQGTGDNGHAFGYENPHVPPAKPVPARIVALLSWYDEDPAWLERCIRSLPMVHVAGLIALDGAYSLYPDAKARSHHSQTEAIERAAQAAGIPCQVHHPTEPWDGEVQKRNRLFELAETTSADWYMIVDADEFVTAAPDNVPERLAQTPFDVAAVTLREPGHPMGTMIYPTHPKFFRAIPGLRAVTDHFTYTAPDGRKLWGNAKTAHLEPRADLTAVTVEHHNQLRHPDRRKAALTYYQTRDQAGVEELPTERSILADAA